MEREEKIQNSYCDVDFQQWWGQGCSSALIGDVEAVSVGADVVVPALRLEVGWLTSYSPFQQSFIYLFVGAVMLLKTLNSTLQEYTNV